MFRILWILLFLVTGMEASITAAWKVPIEHFAPDYKSNDLIRKLDQPPGESGFFEPDDELWEVSKMLWSGDLSERDPFEDPEKPEAKRPWSGDWAVWNSHSGMLVARGGYFEILEAQWACGFDQLPKLTLTRFALKQGAVETELPVLSRSGERVRTRIEEVDLELDSAFGRDSNALRCSLSWQQPGRDAKWNVTSDFSAPTDREVLVARHGRGDSGWELRVTVSRKNIGGVPVGEARWIEIGGKAPQSWDEAKSGQPLLERQPLEDGRFLAIYQAPFGIDLPSADLEAPECLSDWVQGSFRDLGRVLAQSGIDPATPGSFAGIETRTNQLVFVGNDAQHDLVLKGLESAFSSPPDALLTETDEPAGNWALRCDNGFKGLIALTERDKNVKVFEVEASLEEEKASVALKYRCSFTAENGEPLGETATLKVGDWQVSGAAGKKHKLRVSLESP